MDPLRLKTDPGLGNVPQSSVPRAPARSLAVGDKLGPYLVRRYMGGGLGYQAFEAEDCRTGQPVVARTLDASQGNEAAQRFSREQDVLGRLPSDHFPRLLFLGRLADGSPYYVVPLYYGESLPERLARGRLPLAAVLELGVGLMRALAALHAFGFIHGALRDEAVFLRQEQAGIRVSLVDLGVCERIMPPASDQRADLQDAGLLMYEALTGQTVPARIHLYDAARPQTLRPDCPPELERLLLRLLSATPAARPRTAGEVREELEAIARAYALPVAYAAWEDRQAASSAPPAALAWGPGPESSALALPEPPFGDGPAEREFFGDSRAEPPPRPRFVEPVRTARRHWLGQRWLPLVLGVVAFASGFTGYALVAHDEGTAFEDVGAYWRSRFVGSKAADHFASAPLAARDFRIDPAWPLVPAARGVAQPELEVQAAPSTPPPSRAAPRRVTARRSARQWDALPVSRARAAPKPSSVPSTWDALPEEHGDRRRASASDNPYE